MQKSYIWSLPTRVFHWLFVVFILLAFITAEEDRLLNYHAIIGYTVLILLLFRLVWGVFGTKYSRFKDFPLSIKNVKEFIVNIFNKEQEFVGHNPMASYVMIAMFITVFLIIVSGVFTLGIQEGKGLLASLNLTFFKDMELFEELHEVLATLLIVLIVLHLGGIVFDRLFHSKQETLQSIFTGYKKTKINEFVQLNLFQKSIAFLFLLLFIVFVVYNIVQPKNLLVSSIYTPINYEQKNELFVSECASCHTLYPPHLLSKNSWHLLMSDLENHFGDDASLDIEDHNIILAFLLLHSAETSTMEVSKKILDSIENKDIITISKTTFWEERHQEIAKEIFLHEQVKSKANCKACHKDIEKGLIEDENIKDIRTFM
jgi:cytochrome b